MTCPSLVISIEESEAWQEYVHRDKGIKTPGVAYACLRCKRLNSESPRL
jgi:hypothetical protein